MVGHWYGGLGLAGVLACALFAAVSGSSPATVVAIGSILLPAMVKAGFPNKFGAGVITTSGALGILIPPSIVMVMYSVATNTSVGALFMAGVIPGMVLAWCSAASPGTGQEVQLSAHEEGHFGASAGRPSANRSGACC
jgi:C4-dicarboxylate transporter DctM subunit